MPTAVGLFIVIAASVFFTNTSVIATPIYGTATLEFAGYGAKDTMTIWGGRPRGLRAEGGGWSGLNVYAGVHMFNKTAGTGEGELLDSYIGGFCMELSEYVAQGSFSYDVLAVEDGPRPISFLGDSMGQEKADYIAELWGRFYAPAWSAGGAYTEQQNREAEAFAAAIWEIIYEDLPASSAGWDVAKDGTWGRKGFKATNLDEQLANSWLGALDGTGEMADLRALSAFGAQDFIVQIPEPATVAFLAFGFMLAVAGKLSTRKA